MQFMLLAPAKAYIVPCPRKPRFVNMAGYTFAVFDGINAYVKTGDKPRFAYTETPGYSSYAIAIEPETVCYVSSAPDDATMRERLASVTPEKIRGWIEEATKAFNDLPAYNAELDRLLAEKRAAWQAQKEKDDAARLEREREATRKDAEAQAEAVRIFATGGRITWPSFEAACKAHGVKMAINTIGAGRKRVRYIGAGNAEIIGKGHLADGIWKAVRELKAVLQSKQESEAAHG